MLSLAWPLVLVAAIITAIALYYLANQKGQVEAARTVPKTDDDAFLPNLVREINKWPLAAQYKSQATQALTEIIDQEITRKVATTSREISAKYQKVIQRMEEKVTVVEKQYRDSQTQCQRIGAEKKQTEAIIHSIGDGLIVVNKKGETVLMNPAAERLLGVKREEKIGKPLVKDLREDQLVSLAQGSEGEAKDIVLQSASDETKKVVRASNAVIESEDGQTVGMVSILTDVTKQRELDRLKTEFVSSVSHELRTPLASIGLSLKVILENQASKLDEDGQQMLAIAIRNGERLTRLINDLLDLSKLEGRKMEYKPSLLNVTEPIQHTLSTVQTWAQSKNVTLEKKVPAEILELEADPDKIEQVLMNLLGNALKFTPAGGKITIEVKLAPKTHSPSNPYVQISVKDTGPGIAPEDLKKLFQKFVQLEAGHSSGGTGLGLAISKEIVELHNGKIWVESELGKGTRFIFEIPQRKL